MKNPKIHAINIQAKQWLDKTYGNTYFSARVTVVYDLLEDKTFILPFQYGYGDQYLYEARKVLKENKILDTDLPLTRYCRENKISLFYNISNEKQRDCKAWGKE